MSAIERNLAPMVLRDLHKKFVFISGPRQVGKTTLAKELIGQVGGKYLLYDDEVDRAEILQKKYVHETWVCLDEFHKFERWKAHLKGVFDKYHGHLHLLLTGSARLDLFQKSGDSLFGRYYLFHLFPYSLREIHHSDVPSLPEDIHEPIDSLSMETLLRFGGFPEPFHGQSETEHRRWSNARRTLLIRQDLRELTNVHLIGLIEHLMLLLPARVGSLFSYRSLAEDLQTSPATVQSWMEMFRNLFIVFRVPPYSKKIHRAIGRQAKFFLYDWSQVEDEGIRFENFIASHLYRACQIWTDLGEANLSLHFVRDRDRREVDFLVTREGKPAFLVEAKLAETSVSENLRYFANRLSVPGVQLTQKSGVYRKDGNLSVISADRWLGRLP